MALLKWYQNPLSQIQNPVVPNQFPVQFKSQDVQQGFSSIDPNLQSAVSGFGSFPLTITSTMRSPSQNRAVGGVPNSFHMTGQAVDLRTRDKTPEEIDAMIKHFSGLGYQAINEGDHLHIEPGKGGKGGYFSKAASTGHQSQPTLGGGGGNETMNQTQQTQQPDYSAMMEQLGYGKKKSKVGNVLTAIGDALMAIAPAAAIGVGDYSGVGPLSQMLPEAQAARASERDKGVSALLGLIKAQQGADLPSNVREFQYYQNLPADQRGQYEKYLQSKKYSPMAEAMMGRQQWIQGLMGGDMGMGGVAPTVEMPQTETPEQNYTADEQAALKALEAGNPTDEQLDILDRILP